MLRRASALRALAAVLLGVLLLNKFGVLAPDIKPEIYMAALRESEALSRAWRESPKLGEPNFNVGLFPVALVVGLVQQMGISPDLSMRLLRWALLVIGAWGATRLYALIAGPRTRPAGTVAVAVLYVANPYMVTAGDFLAIVLPAAMLPWMVLFLLRATSSDGWRYPAAAALSFAAMSGMNVAVIPLIQLLCLPALLWYAHHGLGATWRTVWSGFSRWALLASLLSAYWLVPSLAALGAGSHVTQFSESLEGIAAPSSYGEVIRGLGLWPLYGSDVDGPWQPGFSSYLTNPIVVVASFLLPLVLVASAITVRGTARRFALLLIIPAAVLMVGVHPADDPTPFGRALLWAFENVPGAAAFRTTNKVGAVLVLGVAVLGALAAPTMVNRVRRGAPRSLVASAAAAVVVLGTWPAWSGGIYSLPLPVPDYWYESTSALDRGPMDQRVWFVPGVAQPQYTWSEDRPDDLNNALLARPSFVRLTLPESSSYGASLLAAVDTGLQEGTLPPGTLSTAARYLGVGDLLVRNDVRWDKAGGARPATFAPLVGSDPDLVFAGSDGGPGEGLLRTAGQPAQELDLPPLQRYRVRGARDIVRTESTRGLVIVDGDGWALAPMVLAGLMPDSPSYVLLGDLGPKSLGDLLGSERRVVVTDSNRRREVVGNRLTGAYGSLLPADEDPGPSISLFGPEQQTVLRVTGGEVEATQVGPLFGLSPSSEPENAFDGDPTTSWGFGDFGRGVGQSVSVVSESPLAVDRISLDIPPTTGQRIAEVRVDADDASAEVQIPPDGRAEALFPGRRATRITLTVTRVEGDGDNPLLVAEVGVPGLQVRRVARLPLTLSTATSGLDPQSRTQLAETPVDVVLSRVQGRPGSSDDEEPRLDRDLTLPDRRTFRVYGLVRPDEGAPEPVLDALAGASGEVTVQSSSRAFGDARVRGSRAFDGDPQTSWVPGRGITGEWVEASFPTRYVDEVVIEQPEAAAAWISSATILMGERRVDSVRLSPGRVVVPVPRTRASDLRIEITGTEGQGLPALSEVEVAGVRVLTDPESAAGQCVPLGTVDGTPLEVRVVDGNQADGPRLVEGCELLQLEPGEHQLRSQPGWTTDTLVLRDTRGESTIPGDIGPGITVDRRSSSVYRITSTAASEPYFLVVGQNVHPGWRATMDGADLGPPMPIDGFAMGWWIDDLEPHRFDVTFAPQRPSDLALLVSGAALIFTSALMLRRIAITHARRPPDRVSAATPMAVAPARDADVVRSPRGRRRGLAGWVSLVVTCWVFGGVVGLFAAAGIAAWSFLHPPRPRTLLLAAAGTMALVPVSWVVGNLGRWGEVSPQLVLANPAPSILVVVALVLLSVGVWRDDATGQVP